MPDTVDTGVLQLRGGKKLIKKISKNDLRKISWGKLTDFYLIQWETQIFTDGQKPLGPGGFKRSVRLLVHPAQLLPERLDIRSCFNSYLYISECEMHHPPEELRDQVQPVHAVIEIRLEFRGPSSSFPLLTVW